MHSDNCQRSTEYLDSLTAVYNIAATLTVRRNRELATWHALHQGKEKETILERHDEVHDVLLTIHS